MASDAFLRFIEPRLDSLNKLLAVYPFNGTRDRTPDDWLDCMQEKNPAGLAALHQSFADFLTANNEMTQPQIWFGDWVWLVANGLSAADCKQGLRNLCEGATSAAMPPILTTAGRPS